MKLILVKFLFLDLVGETIKDLELELDLYLDLVVFPVYKIKVY
jgi:hypothetical protein